MFFSSLFLFFLACSKRQLAAESEVVFFYCEEKQNTASLNIFLLTPEIFVMKRHFLFSFFSPVPRGFAVGELSCHFLVLPSRNLPIWHSERLEQCKHQHKPFYFKINSDFEIVLSEICLNFKLKCLIWLLCATCELLWSGPFCLQIRSIQGLIFLIR